MTLYKVIETIKMLALKHPNINSAYEGNIYDIMNGNPQQKYASVVLTQQSHTQDDTYDHYGFNLFYVDRLVDDMEDNRVQIQSTGKSMLSNIIKAFCEEFDAECENINYQTFTERFADECAGVYCTLVIDMVKDIYCTEKYWDESWVTPMVTVRNQNKSVQFTANGIYTIDYDADKYSGLGKVEVEVNVPDLNGSYDEGYADGKNDGIDEGYADGKQDGYTEGFGVGKTEGLNEGYTQGKTEGIEEGYSQGKSDGFNEGKVEGYTEGKEDGINEQKSKLEGITITENGTYTREDGFNNIVVEVPDLNGSYDEGYDEGYAEGVEEGTLNAGAIIAETAQVLNITENGVYTTKYSKVEDFNADITGYFDDGTPFYNYSYLKDKVFNTGVNINPNSRIEVWWKPNFDWDDNYYGDGIIGTKEEYRSGKISIKKGTSFECGILTSTPIIKDIELENKWYHLILSYDEGFIIDGEFIAKQNQAPNNAVSLRNCYINQVNVSVHETNANGYFGMVKIDDNIFIPTEEGFINYTTNTLLEENGVGSYLFSEIKPLEKVEGNLIRTVNVDITPKINVGKYGLNFGYSTFLKVPEWVDFENITSMESMFDNCQQLQSIPYIDTSKVVNMQKAFYNCRQLTGIPLLDTSNATNISYLFSGCSKLESIPPLNTSKATTMNNLFADCSLITTIPQLDTSNATNISYWFRSCKALTSVPALNAGKVTNISQFMGTTDLTNLTDFGGLIGLKINWNDNYGLVRLPNLTYESCINILNGLYDFTGNGETPSSSQGKLKVHANFLSLVGDEISIANNKGWTITA